MWKWGVNRGRNKDQVIDTRHPVSGLRGRLFKNGKVELKTPFQLRKKLKISNFFEKLEI
jgi:hypothetical protein